MKTIYIFCFMLASILGVNSSQNAYADEARPVFIELHAVGSTQLKSFSYTLRWKIPPVMPDGQEPEISLASDQCELTSKPLVSLTGMKTYVCDVPSPTLSIAIDYPSANPALSSLIVFTDISGASQHIFSAPEKSLIAISDESSLLDIASQYTVGGIKHILIGWDHLLFVLCLLVIGGNLRRTLIAITGFTIAHTITLILASLNLIWLPILFVEILIALSIVILAAEIVTVRRAANKFNNSGSKRSLSWRYPVLVATGFGFIHGFGFASVLANLGLSQSMKISALLFFNLGVELGQFLFIASVLFVGAVFNRVFNAQVSHNVVTVGVYCIGLIASYWMIQRLAFGV